MTRLTALALLLAALLPAPARGEEPRTGPQRFFPPEDLLRIGVFYHPEQWPRGEWKRDLDAIARLGLDFTDVASSRGPVLRKHVRPEQWFPVPPGARVLVGPNPLPPARVLVWRP